MFIRHESSFFIHQFGTIVIKLLSVMTLKTEFFYGNIFVWRNFPIAKVFNMDYILA